MKNFSLISSILYVSVPSILSTSFTLEKNEMEGVGVEFIIEGGKVAEYLGNLLMADVQIDLTQLFIIYF
jgi:hypothetical protein